MQDNNGNNLSRRRFLKTGVGSLTGLLAIGYVGLIGRFLTPPPAGAEPLMKVGTVDDFILGMPRLVAYTYGGVEQGVYVTNMGLNGWLALDFHCQHLNCAVNWSPAENEYICPCHGGVYDINGNVKSGPPPRPLARRVIQIQNNSVLVGGRLA